MWETLVINTAVAFQCACLLHAWPIVDAPFSLFGDGVMASGPPMPHGPMDDVGMHHMTIGMNTSTSMPDMMHDGERMFTKAAVVVWVAGLLLAIIGFAVKLAATWSGGLDMYYCKVSDYSLFVRKFSTIPSGHVFRSRHGRWLRDQWHFSFHGQPHVRHWQRTIV